MRTTRRSPIACNPALLAAALLLGSCALCAQEKVIYSPSGSGDVAPFVTASDESGNLYGADWFGGTGYGSILELSPSADGSWTGTDLYTFSGPDGWEPLGVIRDSAGNLYGTTLYGGAYQHNGCIFSCGTVFELSPNRDGAWTETILYSFTGGDDGANPQSGLVFDKAGNLYGSTVNGGVGRVGVVFELSPANGAWTETVLHTFGRGSDGALVNGNLALDQSGNIYGTAATGGTYKQGIAFELSPSAGTWKETVLHEFGATKSDGNAPFAGVILDAAGNVYGTASAGGGYCAATSLGCGTVYELTHSSGGGWRETTLYRFAGPPDASSPDFPITMDGAGTFYGAGNGGSETSCQLFGPCGTVFKLAFSGGAWHETVLHSFAGSPGDGNQVDSAVILGKGGRLYGGTKYGGAECANSTNGCGVVYEIRP